MAATKKKAETNGTHVGSWTDDPAREEKSARFTKKFEEGATSSKTAINLPELQIESLFVPIIGDSELICNKWSHKAITEMLGKQVGDPTSGREKKDPMKDFLGSLYMVKDGRVRGSWREDGSDNHPNVYLEGGEFVFPSIAIKCSMVEACTSSGKAITKVAARQCFQVVGETFKIEAPVCRMRRDMVRLKAMGNPADIRFRGGFPQWGMTCHLRYNKRVLSSSQLVNLLNMAGFAVGIGEWRSERDGSFGLFHVAQGTEYDDFLAANK